MSAKTTKKQRRGDSHQDEGPATPSMAVDDEGDETAVMMLAEMKKYMSRMQNEMDDMRGRLAQVDELETSRQRQMDDMKSRLSHMDELETKCKAQGGKIKELEVRCGCLERSTQILIKENKWKYSAPSIPTSYWIERGFDEEYIEGMECLLEQMTNRTIELRSGKCNDIVLSGGIDDDNDETILLHDDILLPHWKECANALQLYQNSGGLLDFSISNVQLTSSVMDILATALEGKTLFKNFELINNEFVNVREGIEFAVKSIESNPNLEEFYWANNNIERMEDARYLVDAIISHPRIDHISLENCFGEDINGYEILRSLVTSGKRFLSIDLERNNIRTGGSTVIPDFLATNPPLKKLFLVGNHLNDDDAVLIARALKQNTNLQCLRLGDSHITDIGLNALSNAICDTTSLNSVSDSNNTCNVQGIDLADSYSLNNYGIAPKARRARKIYHLLSLRNREGSNVQHLNSEFEEDDGSLALVPRVLESVYRYSRNRQGQNPLHPLSIMYEILRSWKMPELYENSSGVPKVA